MRNRVILFSLVTLLSVYGASANLLTNPSWETGDLTGWNTWGGGTMENNFYGFTAQDGTYFVTEWTDAGRYQAVSVTPGQTYNLSAWVASAAGDVLWGDGLGYFKLEWLNSAGGVISSSQISFNTIGTADLTIPTNTWTLLTLNSLVAPANAASGQVLTAMWASGDTGGGRALYDNVSFDTAAVPEPGVAAALGLGGLVLLALRRRRV